MTHILYIQILKFNGQSVQQMALKRTDGQTDGWT